MDYKNIIQKEATISVVINAVISAFMFWLLFGLSAPAEVRGAMGYANDFFPQVFMVSLMGGLVPALLTLKRMKHAVSPQFLGLGGSTGVIARCVVIAALAALFIGGTLSLGFHGLASPSLPAFPALAFKVAVGAGVATLVTPLAVKHVLGVAK